jgi:hypothetical protein
MLSFNGMFYVWIKDLLLIIKDYNQGYHFLILLKSNVYGYGLRIRIKTVV